MRCEVVVDVAVQVSDVQVTRQQYRLAGLQLIEVATYEIHSPFFGFCFVESSMHVCPERVLAKCDQFS